MKNCPWCAEEIQDAAIKCRWCGSMVGEASMAPTRPVATTAAVQAVEYTHSGHRYVLGYGTDFFGIWDRQAPGPPVERFPRTNEGWADTWRSYAHLEPRAARVVAPPPAGPHSEVHQTTNNGLAVASMVLGILWLWWVGSILALVFGYVAKAKIDESGGQQGGRGMAIAGIVLGWVEIGLLFVTIIVVAANS